MSLRLSIYSYNYAPEPTGIPFYNTGMATWLHQRRGWAVTMHTGLPHYPWWRVPDAYRDRDYRGGRGDEVIDGVVVERVRHYVPSPPVGGRARMRLDASWLLATARRSLGARRRPHAIVVVAPPFLGGLLGWLLGLRFRAPVVYHVQDLQVDAALELKMIPQRLAGLLLGVERFILERMDLVTTVSRAMRARLQAKAATRRPVALFPNWADTAATPAVGGAQPLPPRVGRARRRGRGDVQRQPRPEAGRRAAARGGHAHARAGAPGGRGRGRRARGARRQGPGPGPDHAALPAPGPGRAPGRVPLRRRPALHSAAPRRGRAGDALQAAQHHGGRAAGGRRPPTPAPTWRRRSSAPAAAWSPSPRTPRPSPGRWTRSPATARRGRCAARPAAATCSTTSASMLW